MSWAAISSNNNNTNDRLLFLYANLIGTSVVVETDKGAVWEGLFGSVSNGEVLLQSARLCVTPGIDANAPGYWVDCLKLMYKNILSISANGTASVPCGQVSLSTVKKVAPQVQTPAAQIDWAADSDDEGTTLEEQEKKYVPGTFDQFGVNQKKFGVKSTYKETDYTTDLNQRRYTAEERARAENLTRDINSQAVRSEAHAIERGLDSNVDEGTLYSDVRRGGGNNHHKDPVTPSSPSDMGLRNAQPGSWAEQQKLKKAGKLPVPASSTPNTPTAPAPASTGKKSAFAAAASVPVTVSTPTGSNASKPATPNQPSSSSQPSTVPTAVAPVPKKSNLSAGAPAFNVGAAPWTPGGAPVAAPSLFADILSGGAIRYTHREINTSLFYWIEPPMQQQQQHQQQPPSGHYGGNQRNNNDYGPRGGGGGGFGGGGGGRGDYNSNQHGQQGYVPQVHVAAAHPNQGQLNQGGGGGHHHHMSHSNHQQHSHYQPHPNHQQPPLQHQHHHHRDHQQQQQGGGGGGYGGHSHSYNNNNNNGPAPHHHQQQQGPPPPQQQQPHDSSNMAPPPPSSHMQQQHAPASIGRGGGVSVGNNNNTNPENAGPVVSSVMRGRGRGRATGGLN